MCLRRLQESSEPCITLVGKLENGRGLRGSPLRGMLGVCRSGSDREMKTPLRGKRPRWIKVTSGVPKGCILTLHIFLVYKNDVNDWY